MTLNAGLAKAEARVADAVQVLEDARKSPVAEAQVMHKHNEPILQARSHIAQLEKKLEIAANAQREAGDVVHTSPEVRREDECVRGL